MFELTIEKGIPLPPKGEPIPRTKSRFEETLEAMEIGDSVFMRHIPPVLTCMAQYHGIYFEIRDVKGGQRLWRVENPALKLIPAIS